MRKSITFLLTAVLIVSILAVPTQTVYAQVTLPADINKTFTPISISAGGTSILRVTIFNPNPFQLTSAAWTDNMPANITIVGIVSNTCGGTLTANAGSSDISLSNGTVPAKTGATSASCTVSVNVTSSVPGNWINIIPPGRLSSTGPGGISITNATEARATLNVTGTGIPTVSKSFSPTSIFAGGVSQLTINIVNNANTTLTGTTLRDDLPTGVFLATPPSPALSGCTGTVTPAPTGTSVELSGGTIAAGATCRITVNVTGNVQGAYTNTIPANRLGNNQNLTNNTPATARLNVREIGLTKSFSPSTVAQGGTTTLNITLQNPKSTPYTGVAFTDTMPTPLTIDNVASNSCGGNISITPVTTPTTVSLTGGTIPPGTPTAPGTCTISVVVRAPANATVGPLTNRIGPGVLTTSQGIGNLTAATSTVTVVSGTDVTGAKTFTPPSIPSGGSSRLRIDIFAPGSTTLTNFSVTDPLPASLTFSSNPADPAPTSSGCGAATLTVDPISNTISLTGGTIAAGTRCRIDAFVTGTLPASYTNTIPPANITNDQGLQPTGDITSTLTVTAPSGLSLSLVKGFNPPEVFGGAASTMSIQLINPGSVALTGITFRDDMPNGMFLANPTNFNMGTCGGTLTGNPGDQSFVFSGGSLPAFGSCILSLSATMSVNSNLTNTINAQAVTTDQGVTNLDPTQASLTNQPGASISKSFAPNPIPAGSYSLLTIIVQNTGNIDLSGMVVSDSLPAGLAIASGSVPAPVNNCGGSLTAVPGTQLIELTNGVLAGNAACTMVVAITGSNPGDYQNTIPEGGLHADPNTQNTSPASATLTISGTTVDNTVAGTGGGGGERRRNTPAGTAATGQALIPVTAGFAPGMVTKLDASARKAYDATGLSIQIPVIKVNTPIVGVESNKGNWDISWLRDQVGWLNGTAYPTWKGNSVLTAHVVNADGKPGVFYNLKSLGLGEYIFVNNAGYRYTYKVLSNSFIQPTDSAVMKHEEKSHLTLITCDTYDEATGKYKRYVMVRAELVDMRRTK